MYIIFIASFKSQYGYYRILYSKCPPRTWKTNPHPSTLHCMLLLASGINLYSICPPWTWKKIHTHLSFIVCCWWLVVYSIFNMSTMNMESRYKYIYMTLYVVSVLWYNSIFNMSTMNMKKRNTPIYITLYLVTGLLYNSIFNMSTLNMKNIYTPIYITLYLVTGLLYNSIFNISTWYNYRIV